MGLALLPHDPSSLLPHRQPIHQVQAAMHGHQPPDSLSLNFQLVSAPEWRNRVKRGSDLYSYETFFWISITVKDLHRQ